MFKRLAFISKLFFFLLFHKAPQSPQDIPLPSCKSQWSNFTACPHLSYCSTPALQPSTILLNGDMQKSQPPLSSSPSRALSLIILSLGYATCIHSVPGNISLAVCSCTDRVAHFHLHKPHSPLLKFTRVFPVPRTPSSSNAHQPHRHVIRDSQFKSAFKLLSQTQIQIIWPSMSQNTNTIHLKNQILWPGIVCWRKFLPCYFRTQQNFQTI